MGARRTGRGGRPQRPARARIRSPEAAFRDDPRQRHRLALGTEARSRALLSKGETAENCYREAIERLGRTRMRPAVARAHLLYGEWLRRENRRRDARAELRTAHDLFTTMGIEAFAERARRELLATGDTVRKRTVETVSDLTAQEEHIARLAVDGRTNVEIGARYTSAPGPSNGISARCTPSSESAHAESCGGPWPASRRQTTGLAAGVQPGIGAGSARVASGGGADRARMLPLGSTSPATAAATTKISAEYTNAVV